MTGIRPPEYFPGLDFCALLLAVDRFVIADTFPFSRQSLQNRARVRSADGGHWISVPLVGGGRGRLLVEAAIDGKRPWWPAHRRALGFDYRSAPYFEYYEERVLSLLRGCWPSLGALTVATVQLVHGLLGAECELVIASETLPPPSENLASVVASVLAGDVLATTAGSLDHDRSLVDRTAVVRLHVEPYRQVFPGFVPGLSVLDLLFNLGPDARAWIRERTEVTTV